MTDAPTTKTPDPQEPLIRAGVDLLRHILDQTPLNPHVFDELSVAASALHKACTALDPVLNLPRPGVGPLAPSPSTEGAGAGAMRQLVGAIQEISGVKSSKESRKDVMGALVLAERAGLYEDARLLRAELHGTSALIDEGALPPKAKVDRAKELIETASELNDRAQKLMDSIRPDQIVDVDSVDAASQ